MPQAQSERGGGDRLRVCSSTLAKKAGSPQPIEIPRMQGPAVLVKLDELQEIGRFASLKHKAPQFARLTLIYARNAYGKSTLSAVLRSASEGNPDYISARKKLDAKGDPSVRSSWFGGPVNFEQGQWKGQPSRIYVFDQEFVQQNVHVGDSVTRDNKRSLVPVVLGEEGVRLARRIVDLDQSQRETVTALKEQAAKIKTNHPSINDVSSYCSVSIPADIDNKVATAARSEELARQTVAVRTKPAPKKLGSMGLQEFQAVCGATIESLSRDVAAKVRTQIERHKLGAPGDRWLKFGVEHVREDTCPFCNQSTKGLDIIEAYKAYYSEEFAKLINAQDAAVSEVRSLLDGADTNWRRTSDINDNDLEFWQSVTELPVVPALDNTQREAVETGLRLLANLLIKKAADPLAPVVIDGPIIASLDVVNKYNQNVEACSNTIEAAKQTVKFADHKAANTQHLKLLALKARQSEPMLSMAAAYLAVEQQRDTLAAQKEAAQRELKTYAPATIAARQASINAHLSNFGTDFRIVDARTNFVGREPNTDYAIAIGRGKVVAGEKSDSEPSFKTVLSAADKTTLALAFFIAQVRADPNLPNALVVFDDPFNSQDMNRQFETTSQIRAVASQAAQVMVMSHDPRFLHMIEKDASGPMITLQLQCSTLGEGSISPWNSADEIKDLYVRNSEIIREYAEHGKLLKNVTEVTVLQAIRPFLEDYIRARFPGRFGELIMLSAMADEIEQSGASDPLFIHVADLRTLNEYTRPNMHGGGHVPDPNALRAQCKRVIGIVGQY